MPLSPGLQNLFKTTVQSPFVRKGDLITFGYAMWVHDPYPMVIVADDWATVARNGMVRGVNLHYLTFNYIKDVLALGARNAGFGYGSIKGNKMLTDAFRSYKLGGVKQVKKLDANFILTTMALTRGFDPLQVEKIRGVIREQIRQQINPTAGELTGTPQ